LIGVVGLWEALRFEYTDGIEAWKNIKGTLSLVLELLEWKKGRIVTDMDMLGFQ
jgi:hypothetical protein